MKSAALILAIAGLAAAICPQSGCPQPCTSTLTLPAPTFGNLEPTTTTYLQTVTSTSTVNCNGCAAVTTVTRFLGVGPVKPSPTTTVTIPETISTIYVCKPTPVPQV